MITLAVAATIVVMVALTVVFYLAVHVDDYHHDSAPTGLFGILLAVVGTLLVCETYGQYVEQQEKRECAAILGAVAKEKP